MFISVLIQTVLHRKQDEDWCVHEYIIVTQILSGINNGQKSEVMMLGKGNIHVTSEKLLVVKPLNTLCLY